MITREQAARQAVEILARGAAKAALMTPREAAEAAHYPGDLSVDELTHLFTVTRERGVSPCAKRLNVDEVAEMLGITVKRLRALRNAGQGPLAGRANSGIVAIIAP